MVAYYGAIVIFDRFHDLGSLAGGFAEFVEVGDDRFHNQILFPFCFGDFDDRSF